MCGVIGYFSEKPKAIHKEILANILLESRIRGLHSFGVACGYPGKELRVEKFFKVASARNFIRKCDYSLLIAHTRYSTSGDWKVLENNQPVVVGNNLLVFNGVIRMSTKKEYEKEFGEKYKTDNDGEIMLKLLVDKKKGMVKDVLGDDRVSYAGIHYVGGKAYVMRNSRRPLWHFWNEDMSLVFSTFDIGKRALGAEMSFFEKDEVTEQFKLC